MHDGVTKSCFAHLIPAKRVDFPSCEKVVTIDRQRFGHFGTESGVSVRQMSLPFLYYSGR